MATKFYLPIHLVPALIFKFRKLRTDPLAVVKSFFKGYIRSCLFLATYIALFRFFLCFTKNTRQKIDRFNPIVAGLIAPLSILWEPKGRRAELTLYLVPKFLESLWNWLLKHKVAVNIPNGEVIIFAVAMAVICYSMQNEEDCVKPTYRSMFRKFYGDN